MAQSCFKEAESVLEYSSHAIATHANLGIQSAVGVQRREGSEGGLPGPQRMGWDLQSHTGFLFYCPSYKEWRHSV